LGNADHVVVDVGQSGFRRNRHFDTYSILHIRIFN
jgi:hypothetical protein